MRRSRLRLAFVVAGLILQVAGCGGGSGGGSSQQPMNPTPSITGLSPSSILVGTAGQTLTINGSNFISTSTVTYNATDHTPTFVNADQLTISLDNSDLATAGSFPVVVSNPLPGGGSSNSQSFTVNNPVPKINSLSPPSLPAGAVSQTLAINGTGFVQASTVTYNNAAHTPTYVNTSQLTISLSTADLTTVGSYPVVVSNPAPGGGPSNTMNFAVSNIALSILSTSPANQATEVSMTPTIQIQFNQQLNPTTVNPVTFSFANGQNTLPTTISFDPTSDTVSVTPSGVLEAGTTYTVIVAAQVSDLAEVSLGMPYSFSFTTASPVDITGSVTPPPGVNPTTLTVLSFGGQETAPASDGSFAASVRPLGTTVVAAMLPGQQFGLLALTVTGSTDTGGSNILASSASRTKTTLPFFRTRWQTTAATQAANTADTVVLNFQTTAETLVFLSPNLFTADPERAPIVLGAISSDTATLQLAQVLAEYWYEQSPIQDPNVQAALQNAVASVIATLTQSSAQSNSSATSEVVTQQRPSPDVSASSTSSTSSSLNVATTPNCWTATDHSQLEPNTSLQCLDLDYMALVPDGTTSTANGSEYVLNPVNCANSLLDSLTGGTGTGCAVGWLGRVVPLGSGAPALDTITGVPDAYGYESPTLPDIWPAGCGNCQLIWLEGNSAFNLLDVVSDMEQIAQDVGTLVNYNPPPACGGTISFVSAVCLSAQPNQYVARFYSGGLADATELTKVQNGDFADGLRLWDTAQYLNDVDTVFNLIYAIPGGNLASGQKRCVGQALVTQASLALADAVNSNELLSSNGFEGNLTALITGLDSQIAQCNLDTASQGLLNVVLGDSSVLGALNAISNAGAAAQREFGLTYLASPVETALINISPATAAVASIRISAQSSSIVIGQPDTLSATAYDSSGNPIPGVSFLWGSSNPAIVKFGPGGAANGSPAELADAIGVSAGTAYIIAAVNNPSSGVLVESSAYTITVTALPLAYLIVSPPSPTIHTGQSLSFTVEGLDSQGDTIATGTLSWSSSNPQAVTINSATGVAQAVGPGRSTITVTAGNVSQTVTVTVIPATIAQIDVAPQGKSLAAGQSFQYSATAVDSANNPIAGITFVWSSGSPSVATVSTSGLVAAVSAGTSQITASAQGLNGFGVVTVEAARSYVTIDDPVAPDNLLFGIANTGQIVGDYDDLVNDSTVAFLYTSGSFSTIYDPAAGGQFAFEGTEAFGINSSGQIVGGYTDPNDIFHGFLYAGGNFSNVDDPAGTGTLGTTAYGISNNGQIVGAYYDSNNIPHGFLYANGSFSSINYPGATSSFAYGINDSQQIVGTYSDSQGNTYGFLYTSGKFISINYPSATGTYASGINTTGQVVGYYYDQSGVSHGFLDSAGNFSSVDFPGAAQTGASGINDSGQIVGWYQNPGAEVGANGEIASNGFLATPAQ